MHTLHVIDTLGPGGAEQSLAELVAGLRARGVESTIACFEERDEGPHRQLVDAGFDVRVIGSRTLAGRVLRLRRLVRELDVDLIHTSLYGGTIAGRLSALGTGVPVLTSIVNTSYEPERLANDPNLRPWKLDVVRRIDATTARRNAHFHAVTEAVKDASVKRLHLRPDSITVVYRGRSTERLGNRSSERRQLVREREGIDGTEPVILTAGRQEFQKGHTVLLDALVQLVDDGDAPLLLLAGRTGNASGAIEARLDANAKLRDRVRLLGHRDDLPDLIVAADVFVLPSIYEGAAGVLLEAMHLETPIVATSLPTIVEVLDGAAAALAEPGDADQLAAALRVALTDAARRTVAARAGRARFDEAFRVDRSLDAMRSLYERVVTGR